MTGNLNQDDESTIEVPNTISYNAIVTNDKVEFLFVFTQSQHIEDEVGDSSTIVHRMRFFIAILFKK